MKTLILALSAAASLASAAPALADPFDHGGGSGEWRHGDQADQGGYGYRGGRDWSGRERRIGHMQMRQRWFAPRYRWGRGDSDWRHGERGGYYGYRGG